MMHAVLQRLKHVLPPRTSFRLRALKSDLVDRELKELRRFARVLGGPAVDAVDVGANAGLYSAALAASFRRVVAVEPNPALVAYMREVLPRNCAVLATAVSDREGRTVLRVPTVAGLSETTRATISTDNTFSGLDVSGTQEIDVSVRTLDGMAAAGVFDPAALGFIKIDVEGHEAGVLEGAAGLLGSARPGLCLEVERRHGAQAGTALAILSRAGYAAVRFHEGRFIVDPLLADQPDERDALVNVFFVAREKLDRFGLAG